MLLGRGIVVAPSARSAQYRSVPAQRSLAGAELSTTELVVREFHRTDFQPRRIIADM
jgi:hypothetical protein